MIRTILCLLLLASFAGTSAQSLEELEKRNGFKDIHLGEIADSVKGVKLKKEFKEQDQYPAKLFSVSHPDYDRIGEVKVKEIELKAYKSLIYEIQVVADKDPRLMKALESLYGRPEYDMKNEMYFWRGEKVLLKFRAHGKNHLELIFYSYPVAALMKEDKAKKVDDIANDF